jgi:hypothetical protein
VLHPRLALLLLFLATGCDREPIPGPAPIPTTQPAPTPEPLPLARPSVEWVPDGELVADRELPKEAPEAPCFSPDGRLVAFLLWEDTDLLKMQQRTASGGAVYDLVLQETRLFSLPPGYHGTGLVWCHDTLVVRAVHRLSSNSFQETIWRWDSASGSLRPVLLQDREAGFELPLGLGRRLRLRFAERAPLTWMRMGEKILWMVESELRSEKGGHPVLPESIQIFDRNGTPEAEILYRDTPIRARLSPDGRRLLLVDEPIEYNRRSPQDAFRFEVHDLETQELLWQGRCGDLRGLPALVDDGVYWIGIERTQPGATPATPQTISLRVDAFGEAREVLCLRLRAGETARDYSVSPQQDRILLQVSGPSPRVLVFPIRGAVQPEEVLELRP